MSTEDLAQQPAGNGRRAVLVLPRLRIQNANAISSPLTWGFPAMTAFLGAMTALERRLGRDAGVQFYGVGVVCHGFDPQVTDAGRTRSFRLTRNPVLASGATAAIVEEGRAHLDVTLVFEVALSFDHGAALADATAEREALARRIAYLVQGMRIAGGSVMPPLPGSRRSPRPVLELFEDGSPDAERKQFRRLMRHCLPGFALVSRDDLLADRLQVLRQADMDATPLDAWLDLSRRTMRAHKVPKAGAEGGEAVEWRVDRGRGEGWIVPIPVGFAALSGLHAAGTVAGARDATTPLRFVESVYSMGQWISPHRLGGLDELIWWTDYAEAQGLYRCTNGYAPPSSPAVPANEVL